jgi:hypothetical protein
VVPITAASFSDSTILGTAEYILQMIGWFHKEGHTWQLCYRASTDGWYAKDFHEKCNNKGPTVTLVKVDDYIFGGFTDVNWSGAGMLHLNKLNIRRIKIGIHKLNCT